MRTLAWILPPLLLALASCGTSRAYFIPREDVRAQSPRGWPAAQYAVAVANEPSVGEVRVWSEGAQRTEFEGEKRAVLHVGLEIENRSPAPMVLEVAKCRLVDVEVSDMQLAAVPPDGDTADFEVPANRSGLIDLEFVMPRDTLPRDLESFKLQWSLRFVTGQLAQSTPFRVDSGRARARGAYYGGYGGYGPYYDPWWGFGTGFAVGGFAGRGFWGPRWGGRWCW